MGTTTDPFNLNRFTLAQEGTYDRALSELYPPLIGGLR